LRGVGFFNAVLACPIDGAAFDAALVFSADEAVAGGFLSSVVVAILIPSLIGGGCRSLTGEAV
jgi:hypothetical protein